MSAAKRQKRNKRRSKPEPPPPPTPARRWRLWALLVAFILGAAFLWFRDQPRQLYQAARAVLESNPVKAEQLLEQSINAADGDYPQAQLLRSRALGSMGQWPEALGSFSFIEDTSACEAEELVELARLAQAANQTMLMKLALEAADRPGPEQVTVLRTLIPLRYLAGEIEATVESCRRLMELAPADPLPWKFTAWIAQENGKLPTAVNAYREALKRDPPDDEAHQMRSQLVDRLIDLGEVSSAREELDRLIAKRVPVTSVRLKNAYLLRLEGQRDRAMQEVSLVLTEDPFSTRGLLIRATLYLDREEIERAAADLQKIVKQEPFNKEAHYKLAQAFRRLNQTEQAQQHLETSRRLTELSVKILDLSAQAQREPHNREIRIELGKIYQQIGRNDMARRWRQSAKNVR